MRQTAVRFQWLDGVKGIAVLWIALYHCLLAYGSGTIPWPITYASFHDFLGAGAQNSFLGNVARGAEGILAAIIQRGPQAVGVFILFSGFGLTYSLVRRGTAKAPWSAWYKRRFTRLFPVYWVAHIIFLLSPFTVLHGHFDYRFFLSFLGDRVYPVEKMFFYFVPAWWFMGLLIELYLVYPLLFTLLEKMGWVPYLGLCIVLSVASRYLLLDVFRANGYYEMGAFFVCRLWEFAAGMALGKLMAQRPEWTLKGLLSWKGLFAGTLVYALGLWCYRPDFLYFFSDGLTTMGLSVILVHLAYRADRLPGLGKALAKTGVYSYSIYLLHQPYVMYVGKMMRAQSMRAFLGIACAVTLLVVSGSILIESSVNRAVDRIFFAAADKT
ncbi:MAG: acyltransferase family protein [Syntrophobacteraceae bacterium]